MDNKKKINAFDCICVTDVRISPIKQIEGLTHTKALAEIVFNDQLLIRGIRVVEGIENMRKSHVGNTKEVVRAKRMEREQAAIRAKLGMKG